MKVHKKWWIKFIKTEPRYIPSISPRELTEIGFRAALEWVLKTTEELEDTPIFMQDVIEQELESD